jgi:16S rRNA pseudouridine516 synthase
MLNKPDGYVCSTRDGLSPTVLELIPDELRVNGLFPAGRLDKDSRGFVFLTDDGDFAHRILSPKKHITKYYLVKLWEEYKIEYEKAFADGLVIDGDEKCLPAKVSPITHDKKYALVGLCEGKFHQVKRMFQAVGNRVEVLFRVQIGGLPIDGNLAPGECLELLNNDVEKMLSEVGFKDVLKSVEKDFWAYLINNKL